MTCCAASKQLSITTHNKDWEIISAQYLQPTVILAVKERFISLGTGFL